MLENCDFRKLIPVLSFFFFNFLKLIIGANILVFSVYVSKISFFPIFMLGMIIGLINIGLSLYGIYGVTLASEKKLKLYQYVLSISLIVTIFYMCILFILYDYIPPIVMSVYETIFLQIQDSRHSLDIIDEIQYSLGCCGISGPDDFHERFKIRKNLGSFIPTCTECSRESMENKIGCATKLIENTKTSIFTIIIILMTLDTILVILTRNILSMIKKHEFDKLLQGVPYNPEELE